MTASSPNDVRFDVDHVMDRALAANETDVAEHGRVLPTMADVAEIAYESFSIGIQKMTAERFVEAIHWLSSAVDGGIEAARPLLAICLEAADPISHEHTASGDEGEVALIRQLVDDDGTDLVVEDTPIFTEVVAAQRDVIGNGGPPVAVTREPQVEARHAGTDLDTPTVPVRVESDELVPVVLPPNEPAGSMPRGSFVAAREIHGNVHFCGQSEVILPRMVPPSTPFFTNQVRTLSEISHAWEDSSDHAPHIMVIEGLPGLGKRAVARHWLEANAAQFPDGLFHADLSGTRGEDGLSSVKLHAFLIAAGFSASDIPATTEGRAAAFRSWTTNKKVAVCIDAALTSSQVRILSPGSGHSIVLVTANKKLDDLGVREQVTRVSVDPFGSEAAVELICRIAPARRNDVDVESLAALVEFCDGLPIALLLVGALLNEFPDRQVSSLVAELDNWQRRLGLSPTEDKFPVAAVFNSAYERLRDTERRLYEVLGVHPGTGSVHLDTLAAVLEISQDEVSVAVDNLCSYGLVQISVDERLSIHSLVRHHALTKTGHSSRSRALHLILDHYRNLGVAAGHAVQPLRGWRDRLLPYLAEFDGKAPAQPMDWLVAERENLLASALAAIESANPEYSWELAILLWPLHERRHYFEDISILASASVKAAHWAGETAIQSLLTTQRGFVEMQLGEAQRAGVTFEIALSLAKKSGVRELEAAATEMLGLALLASGDRLRAEGLLRQDLVLAREDGGSRRIAIAQLHLAKVCDPAESLKLLSAAREFFDGTSPVDAASVAKCDLWLGIAFTGAQDWAAALARLSAALEATGMLGRSDDEMLVLAALDDLAAAQEGAADSPKAQGRASEIHAIRYRVRQREIKSLIDSAGSPGSDENLGALRFVEC